MKVSHSLSGAIRRFSYWIANGTVGYPLLEGVNYVEDIKNEPSMFEQVYAIFINNIEMDEKGNVLNEKYAEKRAAEYIKQYYDKTNKIDIDFEEWEVNLY
jgi:hypothetical protein